MCDDVFHKSGIIENKCGYECLYSISMIFDSALKDVSYGDAHKLFS